MIRVHSPRTAPRRPGTRHGWRWPLAGLLVSVLLTAGCTLPAFTPRVDSGGQRGAAPAGGTAGWKPCPEVPREVIGRAAAGMRYDCATISVPRDWLVPGATAGGQRGPDAGRSGAPGPAASGETFDIALLRARSARQQDRIGSLVVNPGGPGASGVDAAVYLSFGAGMGGLPEEVTRRFDIVGFDPRGVGRSTPVKCISDADLDASFGGDPDPRDQAAFDNTAALNRRIGQGCGDRYGNLLRLFSTEQTARDLDAVRAAVGDAKLTYLGYSYGSLLGATYAQLFPRNVRAMVFDGAVDPKLSLVAGSESQAKGFEQAFDNFAAWCSRTADRCPIAPDARAAVTSAMEQARSSPVRGRDGRSATPGWILYAVISSLYTESGWAELADAIAELRGGNPAEVFKLADEYTQRGDDGHYTNLFDANLAVNCADEDETLNNGQIRQLQDRWRQRYPLFGPSLATGLLSCANWPAQRDPYPTGAADGAPPLLVIGTVGDPATPYEQAPRLTRMLGVGVLLTWEGEGHTAYPQTTCVTKAVNGYLIDLSVPKDGTRCPPR